ncbi:MAG: GNAT family N-acetyltransferase [Paludibacter sp.]|nr:GNAT family N-acetyltransferase [Paludibacter sp.]
METDIIEVKSAFEVPENELIEFYANAFENRMKFLPAIWRWLNRTDFYQNKIPLVVEFEKKVIAHAGMIPFYINLEGEKHTAAWFIDFKILEQWQRQGIGEILAKKWIEFSDCCVTFCNEKSIGVFKKIGWQESFNTFLLINFVYPFSHPGFTRKLPKYLCKILNIIVLPLFFIIYKTKSYSKKNYTIEALTDKNFAEFYKNYEQKNKNNINFVTPIRDEKYVKWRILQSPNIENYYIYKCKNFQAILIINNNHGNYIDVLWVSDNCNKLEISKMIRTLGLYAMRRKIAYIRFYTSKIEISDFVKRKTFAKIKHIRFAFYSKNKEIFDKMKKNKFDFELLDSDFEHIR